MKRLPIGLIVLLFVVAAGLAAQDITVIKVKVQSANIRSEPDMNSAVVRQVKIGTLLESRRAVGEWFEVTITDERGNAKSGFINTTVVEIVSGGAKPGGQTGGQQAEVKKPAEGGAPVIIVQQQVQQAQANNQAQNNNQNQGRAGGDGGEGMSAGFKIMGGMGLASMTTDSPDAENQALLDKYKTSKMGYAGGIGVAMGSRIGFEFDLLYLQKGARFKGDYEDADVGKVNFDASVNLNMISVPVLLRFNILNSPSAPALYALGGAEIAYILDGKVTYSYTQGGQTQKGTEKIEKKNMNQIDYGAVVGGGIGLNMGGGMQIFLEARYHIGMSNLMKNADGSEAEGADNVKPKSSLLLLMGGFKF